MLRLHHLNLFHIHRSLHLIFGSPSHWQFGAILTVSIASAASIQQLDSKIDEYEISLGGESGAFFNALSFSRIQFLHNYLKGSQKSLTRIIEC